MFYLFRCIRKCLNYESTKCPKRTLPSPTAPPPSPPAPLNATPPSPSIPLIEQKKELSVMISKLNGLRRYPHLDSLIGTEDCAKFIKFTIAWWTKFLINRPRDKQNIRDLFNKAGLIEPGKCTSHGHRIAENLKRRMESRYSKVLARIEHME